MTNSASIQEIDTLAVLTIDITNKNIHTNRCKEY
jgi:hypothetical protein